LRAIAIARTETLHGGTRDWAGTAVNGLWFRHRADAEQIGAWQRVDLPEVRDLAITDLVRTQDRGREELWVLSYGGGLVRLRDDGLRVWRSARDELPTEAIYSAVATYSSAGERTLWIASRAGLLRVHGDEITTFDRRHGLPSDAVRGIKLQHRDGVDLLWLATEGGVARAALTESQWQTVSLHGARENGIFGVLVEPDGRGGERLWIGSSQQGLALLAGDEWRYFNHAKGTLPVEGVRQILRLAGPDARDWSLVGLRGGRLLRVTEDLRFQELDVPWPLSAEEAQTSGLSRTFDGQHELWFGTLRSGVHRMRDGVWTSYRLSEGSALDSVHSLAEQVDAQGHSWLWAAGNFGLARFDGQHWTLLPAEFGVSDGLRDVTLIRDDERDVLWAGTYFRGVVRIDVTDPRAPLRLPAHQVPASPDPTVYSVRRDSQGRI
jgi:ligand-binding sensor domain-containing protein